MAFYFARIWLTDSAAKLVLIAAVSVAKISAANNVFGFVWYPEKSRPSLATKYIKQLGGNN